MATSPAAVNGLALIQVLLITMLITLLVIQISAESADQINIAIELKTKAQMEVDIESELERAKFFLLTDKDAIAAKQSGYERWNFYSDAFAVGREVKLSLQDAAGLISLTNRPDLLMTIKSPNVSISNLERFNNNLRTWQGNMLSSNIPPLWRGRPTQYANEFKQIPAWQANLFDEELVIYLRTSTFNPRYSPEGLLRKLAKQDMQEQIITLQRQRPFNQQAFSSALASGNHFASIPIPSDLISISADKSSLNLSLKRQYQMQITVHDNKPIRQLGITH